MYESKKRRGLMSPTISHSFHVSLWSSALVLGMVYIFSLQEILLSTILTTLTANLITLLFESRLLIFNFQLGYGSKNRCSNGFEYDLHDNFFFNFGLIACQAGNTDWLHREHHYINPSLCTFNFAFGFLVYRFGFMVCIYQYI